MPKHKTTDMYCRSCKSNLVYTGDVTEVDKIRCIPCDQLDKIGGELIPIGTKAGAAWDIVCASCGVEYVFHGEFDGDIECAWCGYLSVWPHSGGMKIKLRDDKVVASFNSKSSKRSKRKRTVQPFHIPSTGLVEDIYLGAAVPQPEEGETIKFECYWKKHKRIVEVRVTSALPSATYIDGEVVEAIRVPYA